MQSQVRNVPGLRVSPRVRLICCGRLQLLFGTLEFVGPNERDGWPLAGTVVPIAYIAWSVWLIALGVLLLI